MCADACASVVCVSLLNEEQGYAHGYPQVNVTESFMKGV